MRIDDTADGVKPVTIQTNKLRVGIVREAFDNAFVSVRFEAKKGASWPTREQKLRREEDALGILAVEGVDCTVYEYGGAGWLFFDRSSPYAPGSAGIERLRVRFPGFIFHETDFSAENTEGEAIDDPEDLTWKYKRAAFQALLYRSLKDRPEFSNVNGKLIYTCRDWCRPFKNTDGVKTVFGVRIDVNDAGNIKAEVVTFVNRRNLAARSTKDKTFLIRGSNIISTCCIRPSDGEDVFYVGTFGNKKNNVDFLDIGKTGDTQKWSIIHDVLERLNFVYGSLLTDGRVTFTEKEALTCRPSGAGLLDSRLGTVRRDFRIAVIAEDDDACRATARTVRDALSKAEYRTAVSMDEADAVIHVIHGKDKYRGTFDPHGMQFGIPTNCITVEEFSPNDPDTEGKLVEDDGTPALSLKVILENILIKAELLRGRAVQAGPCSVEAVCGQWMPADGGKKRLVYPYVRFLPGGSISRGVYGKDGGAQSPETDRAPAAAADMLREVFCGNGTRNEYLIKLHNPEYGGTYVIRNDGESTMPNLDKLSEIRTALMSGHPAGDVAAVLEKMCSEYAEDSMAPFLLVLKEAAESFAGRELCLQSLVKTTLTKYNKAQPPEGKLPGRAVRRGLEKYFKESGLPARIVSGQRRSDSGCNLRETFCGMKYFRDRISLDGVTYPCVKYMVGSLTAPNQRMAKRVLVRTVYGVEPDGLPSTAPIPDGAVAALLSFMDVDTVRMSQLTVVPYQCKYLREHRRLTLERISQCGDMWPEIADDPNARLVFLDTETDGLPASEGAIDSYPKVLSIGWVVTDPEGEVMSRKCRLVKTRITDGPARAVHGLTQGMLDGGVPIAEALSELDADLADARLAVCHNLRFDRNCILNECRKLGTDSRLRTSDTFDTMTAAGAYFGSLRNAGKGTLSLRSVYKRLTGDEPERMHEALADAESTMTVFFSLIGKGVTVTRTDREKTALLIRSAAGVPMEAQIRTLYAYCYKENIDVEAVCLNTVRDGVNDSSGTRMCMELYGAKTVASLCFVSDPELEGWCGGKGVKCHAVPPQ